MPRAERDETGPAPFGKASSLAVLHVACAAVGLDSEGARLLRLGENALYRLATVPVVVRISRTMDYWAGAATNATSELPEVASNS